ncbi:MAG: DUF3365 domain-containing protein [Leptospira sp.]|nr:DUF3365 domain-containing protein [Leptospira sp.]
MASVIIIDKFQAQLQADLTKAIKERGTAYAVEKCKIISPETENSFSAKEKISIRRISEKFRNPLHKPDGFETGILKTWAVEIQNGKDPQVVAENTKEGFRVMKPILLKNPMCLQCHGNNSNIEPETLKKIKSLYPEDKATGYALGDLRGAFSLISKVSKGD